MGPPGMHFPTAYQAMPAPIAPGMVVTPFTAQSMMQQFVAAQGMPAAIMQPGFAMPQQPLPQPWLLPHQLRQQPARQPQQPQAQEQLEPERADFEYQKEVARQLLNTLPPESLWELAAKLHQRGLFNPDLKGLTVPGAWPPAAVPPPGNFGMSPAVSSSSAPAPPQTPAPVAPRPAGQPVEISLAAMGVSEAPATGSGERRALAAARGAPAQPLGRDPPEASAVSGRGRQAGQPLREPTASGNGAVMKTREVDQHGRSKAPQAQSPGRATHSDSPDDGDADGSAGEANDDSQAAVYDSTATTLILRNLPNGFDQQACQEWVDKAFKGHYDFLLWFPAKKTSRLNNCSYAFVNFCDAQHARRFRDNFHLHRFSQDGYDNSAKHQWPLSVAVAKVQGFAKNYIRYHHLLDKSKSNTLCKPFFLQSAIDDLTKDEVAAANKHAASLQHGETTTLVVRNLPLWMDSQDSARGWLDSAGHEGKYDFFLYFPPKKRKADGTAQGAAGQGLSYAFVNFKDPEDAKACIDELDGHRVANAVAGVAAAADEGPALSVVAARVQGLQECWDHFRGIEDNGRLEPWVGSTTMKSTAATSSESGFQ